MDLKEMFAKISSGEVAAHSELGTRDESRQTRNFGVRFNKMKTVTGINARAMVIKDLVIPFNPFTGKADDTYNKAKPFRPILLVSQGIEGLKDAMKDNPEMKEFWTKLLGIEFTDGPATMEEYMAFKGQGFIFPRVTTYSTVSVNFGGMRGFPDYLRKYMVDPTQLNAEGSYDAANAPVWHKAAVFFNAILRNEADAVVKALEEQGANKDAIGDQRRAVFSKSPVSFVRPSNHLSFLFFPLDAVPPTLDKENVQGIEQYIRYYSFTDKWIVPLKEAMSKPTFDEDIDFFDFTVKTPSSQDRQSNGKVYTDEDSKALYQAMTISNTDGRLSLHGGSTAVGSTVVKNEECFASVFEAARRYFLYSQEQSYVEGGETFEKIMAASSRYAPITSILSNFLPACNDVFTQSFATSPYFTDTVRNANAEFFTLMNPKNALALAGEDEEDLQAAAAEQQASMGDLLQQANEGVVSPGDDLLGVGTVPLSELDITD